MIKVLTAVQNSFNSATGFRTWKAHLNCCQAVHKDTGYAGEHQRPIDQKTWAHVQSILQQSPRLRASNRRAETQLC
jgi:hypothetical protein